MLYREIGEKARELRGATNELENDVIRKAYMTKVLRKNKKKVKPLEEKERKEGNEREELQKRLKKKRQERLRLTEVAGKKSEIEKRIPDNIKEIDKIEKIIEKNENEKAKLKPKIEKLKKIEKPTNKTTEDIESVIKGFEKKEKTLRRQEGAIDSKIDEYKKVKESGICPTCDRPSNPDEFKGKIKEKSSERKQLERKLINLDNEKKRTFNLLKSLLDYEKAIERIDVFEKQLFDYQDGIEQVKRRIKKLKDQIKEDRSFVRKAKKDHEKLQGLNDSINKMEKQDKIKEKTLGQIRTDLSTLRERIVQSDRSINELGETIKKKKKQKKQSNRLSEYVTWIRDYFIPTIKTIETSVLASINEEFNEKFREWFGILVEDSTKDARIDEDFTPIVEQDGYEQDVQYLSGGEKTSVALAYRLSLNYLVQKVSAGIKSNLLILDEPTDGFSKEQLYKVRDILHELRCPQVILVSHEKELESFADHIYQVVKINGVSEINRLHS
jgi:exonuclease SbcC